MKVLLLMLLLLLLCSTHVLTLKCYTCEGTDCKVETECEDSDQYCKTVMNGGEIVNRTCAESCNEEENPLMICCHDDMCN